MNLSFMYSRSVAAYSICKLSGDRYNVEYWEASTEKNAWNNLSFIKITKHREN